MRRIWVGTLAAFLLIAAVESGCASGKQPRGQGQASAVSPTPAVTATATPVQDKTMQIQAFYGNADGTALVQKAVSIRYRADNDKYLTALNALKTAPDAQSVSLCNGLSFHSAAVKDGNLVVDVSLVPKGQLGSEGEALLLQALQETLLQFPEVNTIDILVDGKQVESLMGHMDLPHPIKRS